MRSDMLLQHHYSTISTTSAVQHAVCEPTLDLHFWPMVLPLSFPLLIKGLLPRSPPRALRLWYALKARPSSCGLNLLDAPSSTVTALHVGDIVEVVCPG